MNHQLGRKHGIVVLGDVCLKLMSRAGLVEILRGVTESFEEGKATAIVGPSGSGKTSLLMVIAGLERVTSGSVRVVGQDLSGLNEDQLARIRGDDIGIVFQSFHLIPTMTALENVALPLDLTGRENALERARALLDEVGLGARVDHYPAQLSGGEQQRVALARAMAPEPRLVLADEPTGNLDSETGEQVIELLFDMQKRHGTSLVLVTHDEALASRCDRIVRMADGQVDQTTKAGSTDTQSSSVAKARA